MWFIWVKLNSTVVVLLIKNKYNLFEKLQLFMSFFVNLLLRSEVKKLVVRLNEEKKVLKKLGLTVDGKHHK